MVIATKAQQVEHYIGTEIINGKWKPGQLLPSEHDLLGHLGVSRTTLRHALSALASEGLVTSQQGLGTFVSSALDAGVVALIARAETLASPSGFFQQKLLEEAGIRFRPPATGRCYRSGRGELRKNYLLFL